MAKLRNLGPASWRMLERAGIPDVETLRRIGPVDAFLRVRKESAHASLNLLYAMAAGLEDRDWRALSAEEKGRLIRAVEDVRDLRGGAGPSGDGER